MQTCITKYTNGLTTNITFNTHAKQDQLNIFMANIALKKYWRFQPFDN